MPYNDITELPESIRLDVPGHALRVYLEAYNHAWQEFPNAWSRWENAGREETARHIAWATVRKVFEKDEQYGFRNRI